MTCTTNPRSATTRLTSPFSGVPLKLSSNPLPSSADPSFKPSSYSCSSFIVDDVGYATPVSSHMSPGSSGEDLASGGSTFWRTMSSPSPPAVVLLPSAPSPLPAVPDSRVMYPPSFSSARSKSSSIAPFSSSLRATKPPNPPCSPGHLNRSQVLP